MKSDKKFSYKNLDSVFHSRIRLAIAAILIRQEDADFVTIKKSIDATDGNMTTHITKLEEAGYLKVTKSIENNKPVTRYSLTAEGKKAFQDYLDQLKIFIQE